MAEKLLALFAAYTMGVLSMYLIGGRLMRLGLRHSATLRAKFRDGLDEIEMEAFHDDERKN